MTLMAARHFALNLATESYVMSDKYLLTFRYSGDCLYFSNSTCHSACKTCMGVAETAGNVEVHISGWIAQTSSVQVLHQCTKD